MATIQIREIPEDSYEVVRRRARAAGQSIQAYMRDQVIAFARQPTVGEVLSELEVALGSFGTPGADRESVVSDVAADRR